MARNYLEDLNIVDLEATCWMKTPPAHVKSEIIEIGICSINLRTNDITKAERNYYVWRDEMDISPFCTQLTGITEELLREEGRPLDEVFVQLKDDFKIHKRPWISWGDYDRRQLGRECQDKGLDYPFSRTHTNIKYEFSKLLGLRDQYSVSRALQHIGAEFEGSPHSGKDDAENIARLQNYLLAVFKDGVAVQPIRN